MKDIENNLDLRWYFRSISDKLDWFYISINKNMTLAVIESNPDLPWNFGAISLNPNLTINFINLICIRSPRDSLCKLLENWNWNEISCNSNIIINDIEDNPEYPWNYYWISENPNLSKVNLR